MPTDQEMMGKMIGGMMKTKSEDDVKGDSSEKSSEGGSTTLALDKYPELQGMEKGQKVKGVWEGIIDSIDNENAVISYSSLQLETENTADKELNRITGKSEGKDHKVGDEAEEEID